MPLGTAEAVSAISLKYTAPTEAERAEQILAQLLHLLFLLLPLRSRCCLPAPGSGKALPPHLGPVPKVSPS